MQYPSRKNIFQSVTPFIATNGRLREPQREAHRAIAEYFAKETAPVLVQIPVGCGKTGLMAILPFGLAQNRVLLVSPNLTIRENIFESVDSGTKSCFWRKMGIAPLTPEGPFAAEIDGKDTNVSDLAESHFVVTNVQQIGQERSKWLIQLPSDFFDMILIDEGHHNAAQSWRRLMEHFPEAKIISLTATPFRSDGKKVIGEPVYRYTFLRAMARGYIKSLRSVHVAPCEIHFTMEEEGEVRRVTLQEILKLRESGWFRRGVALAEECNRHIVRESIKQCEALRAAGQMKHQIIAAACSVKHAGAIANLYREAGYATEEIHSELSKRHRENILRRLRKGQLDAIVQVQLLGEGFDHPPLSVAAIFRPFRTLSPYVQFVGRIMRCNRQERPGDPDNQGIVVSHIGLNVEQHWKDLRQLDESDQALFAGIVGRDVDGKRQHTAQPSQENDQTVMTFAPDMLVSREILGELKGSEYGPNEALPGQLQLDFSPHDKTAELQLAGPQQRRRESRLRFRDEVNQAIRTTLFQLRMNGLGWQIAQQVRFLRRQNNWSALRYWIYCELNRKLSRKPSSGKEWTIHEIEHGIDLLPEIITDIEQQFNQTSRRKPPWPRYDKSSNISA